MMHGRGAINPDGVAAALAGNVMSAVWTLDGHPIEAAQVQVTIHLHHLEICLHSDARLYAWKMDGAIIYAGSETLATVHFDPTEIPAGVEFRGENAIRIETGPGPKTTAEYGSHLRASNDHADDEGEFGSMPYEDACTIYDAALRALTAGAELHHITDAINNIGRSAEISLPDPRTHGRFISLLELADQGIDDLPLPPPTLYPPIDFAFTTQGNRLQRLNDVIDVLVRTTIDELCASLAEAVYGYGWILLIASVSVAIILLMVFAR